MDLVLRDTLTGRLRPVRRRRGHPLALYVCGPTVYDVAHVGHARTYLFFDVARRFLEGEGVPVRHVMNVTDIEDKIDARATKLGMGWRALARREERGFFQDLAAIGVLPPHVRPRATAFVPQMIRVARRLERTGRVRREGDEWIYAPPLRPPGDNFPTGQQLETHAVTEPGHPFPKSKGQAGEFMIWKRQDPPKPSWPSPWGRGVPGWHLECYAMAERFLGIPVDLHGGAPDLIYPHHFSENETALALRGTPFSRVFLHTGFVLADGVKMAKSTGNLVPLRKAVEEVGAGPLRWYLLSTSHTQRLKWDSIALRRSVEEYALVREAARQWLLPESRGGGTSAPLRRLSEDVRRDLAHGLATDRAFAHLHRWAASTGHRSTARSTASDRVAARRVFAAIEQRTGLPLL